MELKVPGEAPRRVFPEISACTTSYTFRHHDGLLFATEFAQPALTVMCKAHFADLSSQGLVQMQSSFAGHSLGEYAALASMGDIMTVEELVAITWFRGLNMRLVVQRDAQGHSPYAMVAVNPSKVNSAFTEDDLHAAVDAIRNQTGQLLEVVNYNIVNLQYVCAGSRTALKCLIEMLRTASHEGLQVAIDSSSLIASAHGSGDRVVLERTKFAVPLNGVDVPFHSSFLRPGIDAYREVLLSSLHRDSIQPKNLIGRWIPNVTGRKFSVCREEVEEVQRLTGSSVLKDLLGSQHWAK
jgi:fatty acid synthase subunit beta, fungi type